MLATCTDLMFTSKSHLVIGNLQLFQIVTVFQVWNLCYLIGMQVSENKKKKTHSVFFLLKKYYRGYNI